MTSFKDKTIKAKLTLIMMVTSGVAVLFACVVFTVFSLSLYHKYHLRELTILTNVIGDNCKAAIQFDIPEDAEKTLLSLDADPSVLFACIYNVDGKVIATYRDRNTQNNIEPPEIRPDGHYLERGGLEHIR